MTATLPSPAAGLDLAGSNRQDREQSPGDDDSPPDSGPISPSTRPRPPRPGNPPNSMTSRRLRRNPTGGKSDRVPEYGYRYYDPVTGRWPSRDPLGEPGSDQAIVMFDGEEISYQEQLKGDLAFHMANLTYRWNQSSRSGWTTDDLQNYVDEVNYIREIAACLRANLAPRSGFCSPCQEERFIFARNDPVNLIDILGREPVGPSGTNYKPDPFGHGKDPRGAPLDPHVDGVDKNGYKSRYNPDGSGRPGAKSVPKKDQGAFKKALEKLGEIIEKCPKLLPPGGMPSIWLPMPPEFLLRDYFGLPPAGGWGGGVSA